MEELDTFLEKASVCLKHPQEKQRALALLTRWSGVWSGPKRNLTTTFSNHGAFLHFNQMIGSTWSHVFTFHAAPRHGLSLRGPDTDRVRKAHKHRDTPLDRTGLDAVYAAWSAHPEARPAGNAIELYLEEAADEVWESCLQEVLRFL
ncbi:MAG: hypothetical protein P4L36_23215 [Holophaga sp.]|nr:hypothetical protein [Holophaga sp.]